MRPMGVRCDGIVVIQEPGDVLDPAATPITTIDVPDAGYLPTKMIVSMAADDSASGEC